MHPESHPVPIFCYPVGPVEGKRIVLLVQLDHLDDNMVRLASIILFYMKKPYNSFAIL
jgi:hypothetical protein